MKTFVLAVFILVATLGWSESRSVQVSQQSQEQILHGEVALPETSALREFVSAMISVMEFAHLFGIDNFPLQFDGVQYTITRKCDSSGATQYVIH